MNRLASIHRLHEVGEWDEPIPIEKFIHPPAGISKD